jgi:hypothetical protein
VVVVAAEETVAVDAASGRVRWRQRAGLVGQAGDVAVVVAPDALSGLDIGTGRPRWTSDLPPDARTLVEFEAGRPRIVELGVWQADGTLELRDPVSGAVRGRSPVGRPDASVADAFLVNGTLILGETQATGFRWYDRGKAQTQKLPRLGYTTNELIRCGPFVCVGNNGGLTAFDPATARRVWHLEHWNVFRGLTARVALVYDATGVEAGYPGALVDPATGRELDALVGWQPTDAAVGSRAVLWHRLRNGGVLLAIHDANTGQRSIVAGIGGWPAAPICELGAVYLACASGDELAIWRVPAAA